MNFKIDNLQYCNWSREIFEINREAKLDAVHATVPVRFPSDAGTSAGQIDILRLFPRTPGYLATQSPFEREPLA